MSDIGPTREQNERYVVYAASSRADGESEILAVTHSKDQARAVIDAYNASRRVWELAATYADDIEVIRYYDEGETVE